MNLTKEILNLRKCKKGEWAFLEYRKLQYLLKTLFFILLGLAIALLGLILNKYSTRNIFTVLAMLMVLPGAKSLIGFITLAPYRGMEKERYEKIAGMLGKGDRLLAGIVLTSPEKIMNLDFLVIRGEQVIGLLGKPGQKLSYIQSYLEKGCANWYGKSHVLILADEKKFIKVLLSAKRGEIEEEAEQALYDYLLSLVVA